MKWLIVNEVDKAIEVIKVVARRRKFELEREKERIEEQRQLMLDQVKDREEATVKKTLIEVCCGEHSKLSSTSKDKGDEAIRIYLPNHDMLKRYTAKALKLTIEDLKQENFEVKIWVSIPCSPWCSWQRVNLKTVPNFEERFNEMRDESLILVDNVKDSLCRQ